jgi:hypothetical protein
MYYPNRLGVGAQLSWLIVTDRQPKLLIPLVSNSVLQCIILSSSACVVVPGLYETISLKQTGLLISAADIWNRRTPFF